MRSWPSEPRCADTTGSAGFPFWGCAGVSRSALLLLHLTAAASRPIPIRWARVACGSYAGRVLGIVPVPSGLFHAGHVPGDRPYRRAGYGRENPRAGSAAARVFLAAIVPLNDQMQAGQLGKYPNEPEAPLRAAGQAKSLHCPGCRSLPGSPSKSMAYGFSVNRFHVAPCRNRSPLVSMSYTDVR